MITQERLKEILHYDAETGLFTWTDKAPFKVKNKTAGCLDKTSHKYLTIRIDGVLFTGHRLAWFYVYGELPKEDIDHINGIRSDNKISNLRSVSRAVNMHNQRKSHLGNTSGLIGVTWYSPSQKWRARIVIDKKAKHLGLYDSKEDAYDVYIKAKRIYHSDGCTI